MARYTYLKAKAKGTFLPNENAQAGVIRGEGDNIFFVNITIGTPPIPCLVIMDTGSAACFGFNVSCATNAEKHQTPYTIPVNHLHIEHHHASKPIATEQSMEHVLKKESVHIL
jgi:hypothetical protein